MPGVWCQMLPSDFLIPLLEEKSFGGGGGQGAVSRGIESDTEMSHPSPCHVPVGHVPSKIRSLFSKKHHVIIMTPSNINR